MRTSLNRILFSLLGIMALALASCSDDPVGEATGMTVKVNGQSLQLNSVSYSMAIAGKYFATGATEITRPNEEVAITMDSVPGPGIYAITMGGKTRASYARNVALGHTAVDTSFTAFSGTVEVTEIDTAHARGKFNFSAKREPDAKDTVIITEGTFYTKKNN